MKISAGRVEWTFLGLLIAFYLIRLTNAPVLLTLLLAAAVMVTGAWAFTRITRVLVRHLLWRLRNRLIVAYMLIGLVPVVLITLLVGLGATLLGGQLTIYLVTSEMERRTSALKNTADYLAQNTPRERTDWAREVAPYLTSRYPGLQLVVEDTGKWVWPVDAPVEPLPAGWTPGSGLVARSGRLFGWAYAQSESRRVTVLVPVTREYLGVMAPDIAETSVHVPGTGHSLVHPSLPDSAPSHNRLPPAVNRLDFEIWWFAPIPVQSWEHPGTIDTQILAVRTRPSALLRTLLAQQRVDWASDLVPIVFLTVAVLFLVAELISLIVGVSLTRTITGAVHELYEGTLRARSGDFSHRIPIRGRDQLAELAVSFNQMTESVQRLLVVEKERERLQAELEIAREVQNQLYPKKVPAIPTLDLTASCYPARMVSGDYYDYQQIGDGKVAIAIGDVAGKGISAALLMATVQSSFRSQIRGSLEMAVTAGQQTRRISMSTSHLVSHLNQQLYVDTSPEKYATFYVGMYDEESSTLTYTNAGHLPPVLVRNGGADRLDVKGMVVGAFPFARYGESQVKLDPGDLVVFFTDGISEPENAYGEMFGEDRLVDLILRSGDLPDREIIDSIMDAVRTWTGSEELQDDMTLLLVRRR
jgi:sigma-B regulation protein RsbU (phosphoserine phosphatase)